MYVNIAYLYVCLTETDTCLHMQAECLQRLMEFSLYLCVCVNIFTCGTLSTWTAEVGHGEGSGLHPQEAAPGLSAVLLRPQRPAVPQEDSHAGAHAGLHTGSGAAAEQSHTEWIRVTQYLIMRMIGYSWLVTSFGNAMYPHATIDSSIMILIFYPPDSIQTCAQLWLVLTDDWLDIKYDYTAIVLVAEVITLQQYIPVWARS